ncbi:unnamed protein product [Penicillium salamii]|nr:unnamed protein product [Penicillium salamii]CAG8307192.1 unnamed protein product [Penicillium salamii]
MLEAGIYLIPKQCFRSHPAYIDIFELFHETTWQTDLGHLCDLITAPEDIFNFDNFPIKYMFLVTYKTAHCSFYLPVALAPMYLQLATEETLKQAHDILIPLGQYFQIQVDYFDNLGNPSVIGKIGNDIQDNKCSWLVNQAIQRCTLEQRQLLDASYGRKGAAEAKVKALFNELFFFQLEKVYKKYEERVVGELHEKIAAAHESKDLEKKVFEAFLGKIYKRTK